MTLDIKQVEAVFKAYHEEKELEELRQEKQDNYSILQIIFKRLLLSFPSFWG